MNREDKTPNLCSKLQYIACTCICRKMFFFMGLRYFAKRNETKWYFAKWYFAKRYFAKWYFAKRYFAKWYFAKWYFAKRYFAKRYFAKRYFAKWPSPSFTLVYFTLCFSDNNRVTGVHNSYPRVITSSQFGSNEYHYVF